MRLHKALGIYFSYNQADKDNENFTPIIKKIKAALNVWRQRNSTLIGHITIVKTLALTKLTFVSSFESVPDWVIKEIESAIYSFIWKSKNHKIKRNTLITDKADGGLGMIDIRSMLKAQKIKWI